MTEHYSFPDTVAGLTLAMELTLSLRRFGYRTRLVTRNVAGFVLRTVVATPPAHPSRKERGLA